jgi:hypothetical protein
MDVKQYHRGKRDVDDKAIERGRRILRKAAGLSQNDPEDETKDQQSDVDHDMPRFCRPGSGCRQRVLPIGNCQPTRTGGGSAAIVKRIVA